MRVILSEAYRAVLIGLLPVRPWLAGRAQERVRPLVWNAFLLSRES